MIPPHRKDTGDWNPSSYHGRKHLCTSYVVTWWRHQMETFPRNWPFVLGIHRPPVNSPHRGQWRGALMFSLICVWINDCVNNREAGDLRRYRAHYDVIVMSVYIADDDSTTPEQDINRWQSNDHLIFHGMINLSDILTTLYTQDAKQTLTSEAFCCADHKDMVQELAPWSTPRHKSLYEPVLNYCLGNPWEQYSLTFELKKNASLEWRHNGRDSVSNHQPHDCLLNHLFRRRSKKTWKLRVTGLCEGNSPGTSEFPAQMASNAENVSIWWRHPAWSNIYWITRPQC